MSTSARETFNTADSTGGLKRRANPAREQHAKTARNFRGAVITREGAALRIAPR